LTTAHREASPADIQYQQNLKGRRIAIVILSNPQRPAVHRYIDRVIAAVNAATPGR